MLPDGAVLPEQPSQVQDTLELVEVTPELNIQIKTECPAIAFKLNRIRAEASRQIEEVAGYPQWFQNNVANGIYPSAVGDAMKAYIANVITESNRCEDLIMSDKNINEALEVIPAWPEV